MSQYPNLTHRQTKVIVDTPAIIDNLQYLQSLNQNSQQICAVIKADAYGHGMIRMAQLLYEQGVNVFAVASLDEGIALRQAGFQEITILVLNAALPEDIPLAIDYQLTMTITSVDTIRQAEQLIDRVQRREALNFHLALDTGMGRVGLTTPQAVVNFIDQIKQYSWVNWTGYYTHFATAGESNYQYMDKQWQRWLELTNFPEFEHKIGHYANSAIGLWHQSRYQPRSQWVRYGIALYGMEPNDSINKKSSLRNALTLQSKIIYVKEVQPGTHISYGANYIARTAEWIATIPIGYADGWLRCYQNVPLWVDGHACPIVGVINMEQLMIRLPHYYPVGTTVDLINHQQTPASIAQQVGTIGYEVLTNLNSRIEKNYQ